MMATCKGRYFSALFATQVPERLKIKVWKNSLLNMQEMKF